MKKVGTENAMYISEGCNQSSGMQKLKKLSARSFPKFLKSRGYL